MITSRRTFNDDADGKKEVKEWKEFSKNYANGWRDTISKQKPILFVTCTLENPHDSVNKICADANKSFLKEGRQKFTHLDGFVCIESQGKRVKKDGTIDYCPHLHFAFFGVKKSNCKALKNKIIAAATHGKNAPFKREFFDVQEIYDRTGLAKYLTKGCTTKTENGYDTVAPLQNGQIVKSAFTDVISQRIKKWRTYK